MSDGHRRIVSPIGTPVVDAANQRAHRSKEYREARDEYAAIRELRKSDTLAASLRERRFEASSSNS